MALIKRTFQATGKALNTPDGNSGRIVSPSKQDPWEVSGLKSESLAVAAIVTMVLSNSC